MEILVCQLQVKLSKSSFAPQNAQLQNSLSRRLNTMTGQCVNTVQCIKIHWSLIPLVLRANFSFDNHIFLACIEDSYEHPCTLSAQRPQFACWNFHENKKPFLIGYFGLVCYAPFDWPKPMITLQSRACNKNKFLKFDFALWW